jgi:hypothetical protein
MPNEGIRPLYLNSWPLYPRGWYRSLRVLEGLAQSALGLLFVHDADEDAAG